MALKIGDIEMKKIYAKPTLVASALLQQIAAVTGSNVV